MIDLNFMSQMTKSVTENDVPENVNKVDLNLNFCFQKCHYVLRLVWAHSFKG